MEGCVVQGSGDSPFSRVQQGWGVFNVPPQHANLEDFPLSQVIPALLRIILRLLLVPLAL